MDQGQDIYLKIHKSVGNVMIFLMSSLVVTLMWLVVIIFA